MNVITTIAFFTYQEQRKHHRGDLGPHAVLITNHNNPLDFNIAPSFRIYVY